MLFYQLYYVPFFFYFFTVLYKQSNIKIIDNIKPFWKVGSAAKDPKDVFAFTMAWEKKIKSAIRRIYSGNSDNFLVLVLVLVQIILWSCYLTSPGPNPVDGIAFYATVVQDVRRVSNISHRSSHTADALVEHSPLRNSHLKHKGRTGVPSDEGMQMSC